jgi:enoyl-CoA hydratase/carnithine racemase
MNFEYIVYDVQNGDATITLNRPEERSALSIG